MADVNLVSQIYSRPVPEASLCAAILNLVNAGADGQEINCECGRRLRLTDSPEGKFVNIVSLGRIRSECPALKFLEREP